MTGLRRGAGGSGVNNAGRGHGVSTIDRVVEVVDGIAYDAGRVVGPVTPYVGTDGLILSMSDSELVLAPPWSPVLSAQDALAMTPADVGPEVLGFTSLTTYSGPTTLAEPLYVGVLFTGINYVLGRDQITFIGCRFAGPPVWSGVGLTTGHHLAAGSTVYTYDHLFIGCDFDGGGTIGTLDPDFPTNGIGGGPYTLSGSCGASPVQQGTFTMIRCRVRNYQDVYQGGSDYENPLRFIECLLGPGAFVQQVQDISHNDCFQPNGRGLVNVTVRGCKVDFYNSALPLNAGGMISNAMVQMGAFLAVPASANRFRNVLISDCYFNGANQMTTSAHNATTLGVIDNVVWRDNLFGLAFNFDRPNLTILAQNGGNQAWTNNRWAATGNRITAPGFASSFVTAGDLILPQL